jgi:protocatechuate 3,4-dioxygenase beta subunit
MRLLWLNGLRLARADGEDRCVVNAFILDDEGKGVQGKLVQLSGLGEVESTTDSLGQAKFELTTTVPGQYQLRASVNGVDLKDEVTVVFR